MKEIITEIIIEAPVEKVWRVLTNFDTYPDWNPFIKSIQGKAELGTNLTNQIEINGKTQVFKPVVTVHQPPHHFEWIGKLPLNLFVGRHYFKLEAISDGQTKLIHGEEFTGLLRKVILKKVGAETHRGFIAMNKALKEQTE